jgi:DNA-directed RNA polymerase subunit L
MKSQIIEEYLLTLTLWKRNHPTFAPQIYKIRKNLEKKQIEYLTLMREYDIHKKQNVLKKSEKILEECTEIMNKLKKYELLATLSGN